MTRSQQLAADSKDIALAIADKFMPFVYAVGKTYATTYALNQIPGDDSFSTAARIAIGTYGYVGAALEVLRELTGQSTLSADGRYETDGRFMPLEAAMAANYWDARKHRLDNQLTTVQ